MQSIARLTLLTLAVGLLPIHAVAQNRFCLGGDLSHLSTAEKSQCTAQLRAVRSASATFAVPGDWHFVIVCGEDGWKDYAAFSKRSEAQLSDAAADTDLAAHSTFFRSNRMPSAQIPQSLSRVVAHEIASIVLQTSDEAAINKQLALWIPEQHGATPVLTASR